MHKVAIIGSGPAGHTAAIYAARANLEPVMIEGMVRGGVAGGQLLITTDVENYPGFPEGIEGPQMMALFKQQSERFGTKIISDDVDEVDFSKRPFTLKLSGGDEVVALSVIPLRAGRGSRTQRGVRRPPSAPWPDPGRRPRPIPAHRRSLAALDPRSRTVRSRW